MNLRVSGYTIVCPTCGEEVYVRRIPADSQVRCANNHDIRIERLEHKLPPVTGAIAQAAGYQFVCTNPGCRAVNYVGTAQKNVLCETCKTPHKIDAFVHSVE